MDAVAREKKYLSFLQGPPIESSRAFVRENLAGNWPHFAAVAEYGKVVGWCDISSLRRDAMNHAGVLDIGVLPDWRGRAMRVNGVYEDSIIMALLRDALFPAV